MDSRIRPSARPGDRLVRRSPGQALRPGGRRGFPESLGKPDLPAENELLRNAAQLSWEDRVRLAEILARRKAFRAARSLLQPAWTAIKVEGRRALLPEDRSRWHHYFYSRVRPIGAPPDRDTGGGFGQRTDRSAGGDAGAAGSRVGSSNGGTPRTMRRRHGAGRVRPVDAGRCGPHLHGAGRGADALQLAGRAYRGNTHSGPADSQAGSAISDSALPLTGLIASRVAVSRECGSGSPRRALARRSTTT